VYVHQSDMWALWLCSRQSDMLGYAAVSLVSGREPFQSHATNYLVVHKGDNACVVSVL